MWKMNSGLQQQRDSCNINASFLNRKKSYEIPDPPFYSSLAFTHAHRECVWETERERWREEESRGGGKHDVVLLDTSLSGLTINHTWYIWSFGNCSGLTAVSLPMLVLFKFQTAPRGSFFKTAYFVFRKSLFRAHGFFFFLLLLTTCWVNTKFMVRFYKKWHNGHQHSSPHKRFYSPNPILPRGFANGKVEFSSPHTLTQPSHRRRNMCPGEVQAPQPSNSCSACYHFALTFVRGSGGRRVLRVDSRRRRQGANPNHTFSRHPHPFNPVPHHHHYSAPCTEILLLPF